MCRILLIFFQHLKIWLHYPLLAWQLARAFQWWVLGFNWCFLYPFCKSHCPQDAPILAVSQNPHSVAGKEYLQCLMSLVFYPGINVLNFQTFFSCIIRDFILIYNEIYFLPPTPATSPQHSFLPAPCLLNKTMLSPISATHMHMAWAITEAWPYPLGMILSPPSPSSSHWLSFRMGPYTCWYFCYLDLVQVVKPWACVAHEW